MAGVSRREKRCSSKIKTNNCLHRQHILQRHFDQGMALVNGHLVQNGWTDWTSRSSQGGAHSFVLIETSSDHNKPKDYFMDKIYRLASIPLLGNRVTAGLVGRQFVVKCKGTEEIDFDTKVLSKAFFDYQFYRQDLDGSKQVIKFPFPKTEEVWEENKKGKDQQNGNHKQQKNRPLLKDAPLAIRLLQQLAQGRRKENAIVVPSDSISNAATPTTFKLKNLDSAKWTLESTDKKVFVSDNSPVASVLGRVEYAIATSRMDIQGGGAKIEGLTLLPIRFDVRVNNSSNIDWITIAKVAFGISVDDDFIHEDYEIEAFQKAKAIHIECCKMGEELVAREDIIIELCKLFHVEPWIDGCGWGVEGMKEKASEFTVDSLTSCSHSELRAKVNHFYTLVRGEGVSLETEGNGKLGYVGLLTLAKELKEELKNVNPNMHKFYFGDRREMYDEDGNYLPEDEDGNYYDGDFDLDEYVSEYRDEYYRNEYY